MDANEIRRSLIIKAVALAAATFYYILNVRRKMKRKRISYAPMIDMEMKRNDYLSSIYHKDDTSCLRMLRLRRAPFFLLCDTLKQRSLLSDSIHCCVEEQVAMFLHTIGHNERNAVVGKKFKRSGETVSRYFKLVLRAIGELRDDLIRPPSLETSVKILGNPRWYPYFEVWSRHTKIIFDLHIMVFLFLIKSKL
jgi:hypothetical protein